MVGVVMKDISPRKLSIGKTNTQKIEKKHL
jgi:hypothetical protein